MVWYIYLYLVVFVMVNVGIYIYIPYMDGMGQGKSHWVTIFQNASPTSQAFRHQGTTGAEASVLLMCCLFLRGDLRIFFIYLLGKSALGELLEKLCIYMLEKLFLRYLIQILSKSRSLYNALDDISGLLQL